jgi:tripartite-type tricarboxylate transporter receptor subunit TctC
MKSTQNTPQGKNAPSDFLNMGSYVLTAILLCGVFLGPTARAQMTPRFPIKPIHLIIPFPPSGSNDIVGRFIAQKLTERLGQQIIVENRAGADGIIGATLAASAAADGYTLLEVSTSYSMNPSIHKLPYDPIKSLTAIAMIGSGANVIAAHPSLPATNTRQLIQIAKANPGQLRYASSGIGGFNHFGGELFKHLAKVDIIHVPYKGGGPAMMDVIAGQVEILFGTITQTIPFIRTEKLKVLGLGNLKRSSLLPNVPTVSESGIPGYDCSIWWGILGPTGIATDIINKLNAEIAAILRDPEAAKRLQNEGAEPSILTPDEFNKFIVQDINKWRNVAQQAKIISN